MKKKIIGGLAAGLVVLMGLSAIGCNPASGNGAVKTPAPSASQVPYSDLVQDFVKNSSTFKFDGLDGSVKLVKVIGSENGDGEFTVEYQTRQPGHGDRSGQMLAQVITTHTAVIVVKDGKITSAVCDGSWNMLFERGILQGKVTIGPLQPVQKPGITPTVPPEVYQARKVLIYSADGTLLRTLDIDSTGAYYTELNPGSYTVDINHSGLDRSPDVPKKIEVKAGQTVKLDISIDTGIR